MLGGEGLAERVRKKEDVGMTLASYVAKFTQLEGDFGESHQVSRVSSKRGV